MPAANSQRAVVGHVIRLLHEERKRRGLSKYAVSARCGLTQQTIGYIERGLRNPSFETVLKLAEGIGVDLANVLRHAKQAAASERKL